MSVGWGRAAVGLFALAAMVGGVGVRLEAQRAAGGREYVGFDRNEYPGDALLPALRRRFAFAGYWLNTPPGVRETGAKANGWVGKRGVLRDAGFGFLLLWNGRLDAELLKAQRAGTRPELMGSAEGEAAVLAARREGFPVGAVVFLDQEEGGRLLPEQAGYLLAWTEAVARAGFRPGVYASGQAAPDGPGRTITTADDIRGRVLAGHLHEVALWVAQDACPPAPGCVVMGAPELGGSGTAGALVWQYAQSPRRAALTRTCAKTYAADGSCVVSELPGVAVDLDVARSADPSGGR